MARAQRVPFGPNINNRYINSYDGFSAAFPQQNYWTSNRGSSPGVVCVSFTVSVFYGGERWVGEGGGREFGRETEGYCWLKQLSHEFVFKPNFLKLIVRNIFCHMNNVGRVYCFALDVIAAWNIQFLHCKKATYFPVPSRDVTNQTLAGLEYYNKSRPGRIWL
jgi:hypothetical protein